MVLSNQTFSPLVPPMFYHETRRKTIRSPLIVIWRTGEATHVESLGSYTLTPSEIYGDWADYLNGDRKNERKYGIRSIEWC